MNKKLKKSCFNRQSVGIDFFVIDFVYSILLGNWRECLNTPGCTCTLTLQDTTPTLKTYIIESAGNFLNSHSAYPGIFISRGNV